MEFKDFATYYANYLAEHSHLNCRKLHFIGTSFVITLSVTIIFFANWWLLFLLPLATYGFAWWGHYSYEKNEPQFWQHPFYSLIADFKMFWDILNGSLKAF